MVQKYREAEARAETILRRARVDLEEYCRNNIRTLLEEGYTGRMYLGHCHDPYSDGRPDVFYWLEKGNIFCTVASIGKLTDEEKIGAKIRLEDVNFSLFTPDGLKKLAENLDPLVDCVL